MDNYHAAFRKTAQKLRCNMTPEERKLWYGFLKDFPSTVNRQKVIDRYIVDFYIASSKIVIELDGNHHLAAKYQSKDHIRDAYLNSLGILVLRYSNEKVNNNYYSVCQDILYHHNLRNH